MDSKDWMDGAEADLTQISFSTIHSVFAVHLKMPLVWPSELLLLGSWDLEQMLGMVNDLKMANSVDPDQTASDLGMHCISCHKTHFLCFSSKVIFSRLNPLTHCILNRLSNTIYWKSLISILGTPGYDIYILLEKNGWTICKQWRPWSDTVFCGVWSGSALFANYPFTDLPTTNG